MVYFNSSAISRAEYDPQSQTLQLWFTGGGGFYDFYNVPPHIWEGLQSASSMGAYYNVHIRDKYT